MRAIFVKNLNDFPDDYSIHLNSDLGSAEEVISYKGKQYKLVGTYEKPYSLGSRFWVALRSTTQIICTAGVWLFINHNLQEDWNTIFTRKQTGNIYCDEEGLDSSTEVYLSKLNQSQKVNAWCIEILSRIKKASQKEPPDCNI
jgi:hypothetical protein